MLSYLLTSGGTGFKQNCSILSVMFSMFRSSGGQNTAKGIKWLFLAIYVILVFPVQRSPLFIKQRSHLLQKCIPLLVKALSKTIALVSELATQLAQITSGCINTMAASALCLQARPWSSREEDKKLREGDRAACSMF